MTDNPNERKKTKPCSQTAASQTNSNGRDSLARFEQYLRMRGCPIRLGPRKPRDVQWID